MANFSYYVANHLMTNDIRAGNTYFLGYDAGEAANADKVKALSTDDLRSLMTWTPSLHTWTYASGTTMYTTGNVTTIYPKGTKLTLVNSTQKYCYVTDASYSSGTGRTTLTLFGGLAAFLSNTTISSVYYSHAAVAPGFTEWITWSVTGWTNFSLGNGTMVAKIRINGSGVVQGFINVVYGSTTSISGSVSLAAPITPLGYGAGGGGYAIIGQGEYADVGSGLYRGPLILRPATNSIELRVGVASGTYVSDSAVTASVPFTWAVTGSPDEFDLKFEYMF